jgi:hypothetical protein
MVLVSGAYCPFVAHWCEELLGLDMPPGMAARAWAVRSTPRGPRWAPRGLPTDGIPVLGAREARCRRFRDEVLCEGRPLELHFCIDRFEYPNLEGSRPATMLSYLDARSACEAEGKRLCTEEEWTFACEGPRAWPYPTGLERDAGACNIDRPALTPDVRALREPATVAVEVERLDQRTASGGRAGCVSPFGVVDMTGNVAEWVRASFDRGRRASGGEAEAGGSSSLAAVAMLKGGGWEPAAAGCRPGEPRPPEQRSHETGARCCADAADGLPARRPLESSSIRLPRRRRMR